MTENSYEQVDDLFAKVRLCLVKVRQSNPEAADELKGLITQLEDCVETLVVECLKLRTPKNPPEKT